VICGRYEGVDERVAEALVTDEISIGDYVLSGGELPALVVIDAAVRLVPGVVGDADSVDGESFVRGVLDHPHYTRPAVFRGMAVPDVLISGHHAEIARWRRRQALERTAAQRPDLMTPELLSELADDGSARLREPKTMPGRRRRPFFMRRQPHELPVSPPAKSRQHDFDFAQMLHHFGKLL